MSASEACKKSLVTLESYLRDEHTNSETLKFSANSVLTVDGKKPSPLEEVEILDTIATYVMLKNEEDVKYRLFFEVFPADKDISTDCLYFLIKLSSLAICLGLSPVLEIVSLWLKVRVCQLCASSALQSANYLPYISYEIIEEYVTALTSDMLSIQGSPLTSNPILSKNDMIQSGDPNKDNPLYTIPSVSPAFADAFLSGVTLVYGFHPSLKSSVCNFPVTHEATKIPPPQIILCISHWLRLSRISKQHQPGTNSLSSWTSIDWPSTARRYKFLSHPRFSVDQILMSQPPPPLCLMWWTIFEPLRHIIGYSYKSKQDESVKLISNCISDLHYELLQCLSEPASLSSHRHGSGVPGPSGFSTWLLTCSRKMEYTKEFCYLESMITQVHEQCKMISSLPKHESLGDKQIDLLELMIIRLAEFMQICWVSGRIRNLSSDEFYKLLAPLGCHSWIDLILTRFKR
ncbi:unnamed protein product [Schistosoma rodhaini]|uniref:Uncharacterized protein n=1 Tax=Schistosoma rodhaini TaxID=6188 RepID=A0AA85FU49_9TREM|nr:unnamed protein product [Schistosoma rodhaini]